PHVWGVVRVALQVVALDFIGTGGDQRKALRVGCVDEFLLGFWCFHQNAEPCVRVFMAGAHATVFGDQLAVRGVGAVSCDDVVGGDGGGGTIGFGVGHLGEVAFVVFYGINSGGEKE